MNKLLIILTMLFLLAGSCQKETINKSKIRYYSENNFMQVAMHKGDNGEIFCIGIIQGTDSTIVRRYDKNLNLLSATNLKNRSEFNGKLALSYISNKGWVIINTAVLAGSSVVTMYITDNNFHIQQQRVIMDRPREALTYSGKIYDLKIVRNGDVLIAWDTSIIHLENSNFHVDFGLRISRYTQNLDKVFEYNCGNKNLNPYFDFKANPRANELPNGEIFFTYEVSFDRGYRIIGVLNPLGKLAYQKETPREFDWFTTYGISLAGDKIIHHFQANNEFLHVFDLIDPISGEVIKQIIPDDFYNLYANFVDYGSNTLPDITNNQTGLVAKLRERPTLMFMKVDPNLNFERKFVIPLPTSLIYPDGFGQVFTDHGTIVVGASYNEADEQRKKFVILEMTMDGEIVR